MSDASRRAAGSGSGDSLYALGAEEIAAGVRAGELRAVDVVESCLARTAEVEPSVGAYLRRFDDDARRRAAEIDRRRAAGEPLGPLAGVPVALKDNLNLAGDECTCASKVLAGYRAPYTATAVDRLLQAGAIPLGKTNLDEFAMGSSCENSAYQVTRNPWRLDAVPGGSSGGSAAAVAAGSVPLSLGSDTGGSIRQPAAFCGVVGLKPTYGRVSRYGLVAFASSLDQIGPLARSTRDVALALAAIAGADPADATSSRRPVDDYLGAIEQPVEGMRAGMVAEVDVSTLPPAVRADWDRSLDRVRALGIETREISLPHLPATIAAYYVIANSEASANLARFDGIRYGRRAKSASLLDLYLDSREQGFGPEVKRRILLGTFALSSGYYDAYYGRACGVRRELERQFASAFADVDLILMPTSPTPAFGIGEKVDDPLAMYLSDIFTAPINLAGLPALALPSGHDRGLPLSLQLIGRPFAEADLLRVGRAFERASGVPAMPARLGGEVATERGSASTAKPARGAAETGV
jgi:aspartyl-tRNA(Asn)/glutamyl-tRNA(Gln) amidotransferase subunit A